MTETDWSSLIEPVARHFWGEPNKGLSTKVSLRWGNGGSRAIFLDGPGNWKDFESDEGGTVLDLVMRETGADKAGAVEWLEAEGFIPRRYRDSGHSARPERAEAPEMHLDPPEKESPPADSAEEVMKPVKGYRYTDADGNPLYEVIRYHFFRPDGSVVIDEKTGNPKKTFRQRRPDGRGGHIYNLDGIGHTIYRHQEVEMAIENGWTIALCEGEKDVETLETFSAVATTNSGGSKHWTPEMAACLRDADVVILVDNDEAGRDGAEKKARSLRGIARRVRVLDLSEHVPDFPPKWDVTDWVERLGGTKERLIEIMDGLPDWKPRPPASTFAARRGRDIAGSKIVYDWLVKGLIERGGVFIVAGEKGAGKSFFIMDMAGKIVLNREYCNRMVKQGLVIYLACEDRKGVDLRYEGWRRENMVSPEQDVPFVIMGGEGSQRFSLLNDENVDSLIAECLRWEEFYGIKLELIVIDTLSMATEGLDEIHSGDVGKMLGRVNRLAESTKAAVCLVHHMNGEGSRVRGHSSLTANVSQVIEIKNLTKPQQNRRMPPEVIKDADGRIIRKALLEKNKNGPNRISWRFVLRQVKLGVDDDGFEVTTCVLDSPSSEPDEGQTKTGRLSPDQKLVFDALKDALADHAVKRPEGIRAGPQIKFVVAEKDFAAQVRKRFTFKSAEEEHEARNKELADFMRRNVTALINGGYMDQDTDKKIVWSLNKSDFVERREPKPIDPPGTGVPEEVKREIQGMEGAPF